MKEASSHGVAVGVLIARVRRRIETVAEAARAGFGGELRGSRGKRLTSELLGIEEVLEELAGLGKKRLKRAAAALAGAFNCLETPDGASLKKLRRGVRRARKVLGKAG